MEHTYPSWIDEYARSIHQAFSHMTPANWGPFDFLEFMRHVNGSLLDKLHEAISRAKASNRTAEEIARCFPARSSLRIAFYYALIEYSLSDRSRREKAREIFDWFTEMLNHTFKRDVWAYESNIIHTQGEIEEMMGRVPWMPGNPQAARVLSRLSNSATALSYALYRDFFMMEGSEIYGPYDVSGAFGEGSIFIVKHFAKLRPTDLWPQSSMYPISEMKMYLVYRGVEFRCEVVGAHSIYEGDIIEGLKLYAVEIDGVFVTDEERMRSLTATLAETAIAHTKVYDVMSEEETKYKFLEWLCHTCIGLYELVGMDWKPTHAMIDNLKGKNITGRFLLESMPPFEEFINDKNAEVYWIRELYAGQ